MWYAIAAVAFIAIAWLILAMAFPDRYQRVLALTLSGYRHKKQIEQGTEAPPPQPAPAAFTVTGRISDDHCRHGVLKTSKCPLCAKEKGL